MCWFVNMRLLFEVREGFSNCIERFGDCRGKSVAERGMLMYEKGVGRRRRRLILSGMLNGSHVGVPAYSLQRVQSCVTEAEAPCLCPFYRKDMWAYCAALDVPGGEYSSFIPDS